MWKIRICAAVISALLALAIPVTLAAANNKGDVWVDNVGQPAGPGHEMDPHLACQDINLWGNGLVDSSGSYTLDGWPPSGSQEQVYSGTWHYDTSQGGDQVLDVIHVGTLISNAIAKGDAPHNKQGFHFKLQFSQNPQKHKVFWVNCSIPSLSTQASSASVGQPIHDSASLTGGNSPTGTISWNIYAAGDAQCTTPLNHSPISVPVNGAGTYDSPGQSFGPGDYQWVATYSGDSGNLQLSTACQDPSEISHVNQATPDLSTHASSGPVGQPIMDSAVLSGGYQPGGSISWNVYSTSDTHCTTPLNHSTISVPVSGNGTYSAPGQSFGPGDYQWVATYSGDANNVRVSTACNDPNEISHVTKATPSLTTNAINGTQNQPVHDVAHLVGGFSPSGTITWNLYSAGDTSCQTSLGSVSKLVSSDGDFNSPDLTLAASGNYQWVATYSGDANNSSLSTSCNDPNEEFMVQLEPLPGIHVGKLESFSPSGGFVAGPITGSVGQTVYYQMTVLNTGNTPLTIQFTDQACDANTLSGPTVVSGNYDSASASLASGGELQWTCSHVLTAGDVSGYTNTASATGTPPPNQGSVQTGQASVIAYSNTPGMSVTKLQRDGSSGSFTTNQITGSVGDTINYEIQVSNTGNVPLTISLSDPHCDSGTISGPTAVSGNLNGNVLAAGGVAQWTCSHVLAAADQPSFTNVGTVTGQPPTGPPLNGTGIVTVNVTQAAIKVLKLQSLSSSGPFTASTLTADVGATIYYEIQATNTGNAPLTLSISDPMCDAGTLQGPVAVTGTLNGGVLSPSGEAQYTCSHVLTAGDTSPFTNTATVTGTPPSGPPVSGTSSVSANKAAVKSVKAHKKVKKCAPGTVKKTKRNKKGKKVVVCKARKLSHKPKRITGFTGSANRHRH